MSDVLENAIVYLVRHERFYAEMLYRMKVQYTKDPDFIPTAGVSVSLDGIKLYLNEYFINDQSVEALAEILKHECEHPMRGHFDREKTLEPKLHQKSEKKKSLKDSIIERMTKSGIAYNLNLAEDYSINQDLNQKNFPKRFRFFDKEGVPFKDEDGNDLWMTPALIQDLQARYPNRKIRSKEAFEYYYGILKDESEKNGGQPQFSQDGNMVVTIDCHDVLDDSMENIDPEFAKAVVQKVVNEAKDQLTPQQAGNLPGHLKLLIDKLNTPSKNWRQEMRMFGASCTSLETEDTRSRRNRRYGLMYPGRRTTDLSHIVAVIDSSGSTMGGWNQFFAELASMAKTGVKITFVECDAAVRSVIEYDPKYKPELKGGGGTLFAPAFDLIDSKEFKAKYGKADGIIYLTDGDDYGELAKKPKCKVLWALMPGCRVRYDWGRKCHIEIKDRK